MKEPVSKCYEYALKYISRYPKTEKELKVKLLEKKYLERDIDNTMEFLKKQGFVDDKRFVQSYINSELIKKGKPQIQVQQKLFHKGIDKDLIKESMKKEEEEIESGIHQKIQKEIANYKRKGVEGFDIIQKLMRRGYRLDDIKTVIENKKDSS